MSTLRDSLLPTLQRFRDLAVSFGVRQYQVWLRVIEWSGSRPGLGDKTVTDSYLGKPKVRQIEARDVVAGSSITDQLLEIGPFTPAHTGPSNTPDTLAIQPEALMPLQDGKTREVYFVLKGPGLPESGALYERISVSVERPFRYMVTVRALGKAA